MSLSYVWQKRDVGPAQSSLPARILVDRLVRAARANDAAQMTSLLAQGAPVDVALLSPGTSLMGHCLTNRRPEAARVLLDAGADPLYPSRHDHGEDWYVKRLAGASSALERAVRQRQWDWVARLLEAAALPVALKDERMSASSWKKLAISMVLRNPPVSLLFGFLESFAGLPWLPANPDGPCPAPAELLDAAASCSSTSPEILQYLASRAVQWVHPPDPSPVKRLLPPQARPDPDILAGVVDTVLADPLWTETSASNGPPRLPAGKATGWIIRAWVAAAEDPRVARARVKEWAAAAARQGQAPLLAHTLLPLLPAREVGPAVIAGILAAVLEGHVRTPQVLAALAKHFGPDRVNDAWRHLDSPVGHAWGQWLCRPGLNTHAGTLELARALVAAGVALPVEYEGRPWLECCARRQGQFPSRLVGERGSSLLALLARAGADPMRRNDQGRTLEEELDWQSHRRPGDVVALGPVRAQLVAWRLQALWEDVPASPPARPASRL